jgi:hypothetical protein
MKNFSDLTEQELLARAEALEAQCVPAEVEKAEGESERRLFLLHIACGRCKGAGTEQARSPAASTTAISCASSVI